MTKALLFPFAMFLLVHGVLDAGFWGFDRERAKWFGHVWEAELGAFDPDGYDVAVETLVSDFEQRSGRPLIPGATGRVGLKVYTNSGPGLDTPPALTEAVIRALERRGFERARMLIVDAVTARLREAGYLPPLAARDAPEAFAGVPVRALDSNTLFMDKWYYESPVPPEFATPFGRQLLGQPLEMEDPERRKSPLDATLLTQVDFWINLPMVTDHYALGINGALVNATLWNVGNRDRFFRSPANAPVAVAEIAGIPEMQDSWALTLMTLERYQFVGGPTFNSLYTVSEPKLWLSPDPVILDALILERCNRARVQRGFNPLGTMIPVLDYCVGLGLGFGFPEQVRWQRP